MDRLSLTNAQWQKIEPHCLGKKSDPGRLLPSGALDPGGRQVALYATIALLVAGMQTDIFVPYFLQVLHGQSPLIAGYLILRRSRPGILRRSSPPPLIHPARAFAASSSW